MNRPLFSRGAYGPIVRHIQVAAGITGKNVDSQYGKGTAAAVVQFQNQKRLPPTGEVDSDTWGALMSAPIPHIRERALQLTAAFEGHGFTLAQGNFDGAGITWGIIGFTLKGGELGVLLKSIEQKTPGILTTAFGAGATELLAILDAPAAAQIDFANRNSLGTQKAVLAEPWLSGFRQLGEMPVVQQAQLDAADVDYFQPAKKAAAKYSLKSELGLALLFDIYVQNGGISTAAAQQIRDQSAAHPSDREQDLRVIIANAIADTAKNVAYREDVRTRKLAVATGAGAVHGATYVLRNWGLGEFPAAV